MRASGSWGCPVEPWGIFPGELCAEDTRGGGGWGAAARRASRWNGAKGQGGSWTGLGLGVTLGQRVWDLLAQTQLCGVGLVLLVTKPLGGSRRGAQRRLPPTFPLPTHPKPLLPAVPLQGTAGLCPQGTLLQCHPRQENRSQRGSKRVCRRSWCSQRNTPQQTEPQEVPAQIWALWISEHPMGSTGSSEEPSLSWILLKTKPELWGGGQPLSHSYRRHSTPSSELLPASSEHPETERQQRCWAQGFGAQ